jgi:hypothetical protein
MKADLNIKALRLIKRELKARHEREVLKLKAALVAKLAKLDEAIAAGSADVERYERELLGQPVQTAPAPRAATPVMQPRQGTTTIEPATDEMVKLAPQPRQGVPLQGDFIRLPGNGAPLRAERA